MERSQRLLKNEGILPTPHSIKEACGAKTISVIPGPQTIELISYDEKFCQIIQYFAGCTQTTSICESMNDDLEKVFLIEESLEQEGLEIISHKFQIPKSIYESPNLEYNLSFGTMGDVTHELQRLHTINSTIENFSSH